MSIRHFLAGAVAAVGALGLGLGAGMRLVPNETAISPIARIFDSLAPWFLAGAVVAGLVLMALSARKTGLVLLGAGILAVGQLWVDHRAVSAPLTPDRRADLRVLFFNMLGENAAWADRIVTAILAENPDVVVIAEGEGLYPALARLRDAYVFVSPCGFENCELVVATRRAPARFWTLSLNAAWGDRYAVAELASQNGKQVFVAASQSVKPWLSGIAESEQLRLAAQYDWLSGPVVAVGDFNAAPWGYSLYDVLRRSDMKALRWPVATWPAAAGAFGVPIDHVLVKGGARVVAVRPFGQDMGSNHRGLVADIALPQ